jgi:LL-diaminopimelate aminotransferase
MLRKIIIDKTERVQKLPPAIFFAGERLRKSLSKKGIEILDLKNLNPYFPWEDVLEKQNPLEPDYSFSFDLSLYEKLKKEIALWLEKQYQVKLNPKNEILPFLGKKEAIILLSLAYFSSQNSVLLPDPAEPSYKKGVILAGGKPIFFPLLERNDYLPNLEALPQDKKNTPQAIFLNYPNNPTSAIVDLSFLKEVSWWANKNNILIIHDFSWSYLFYDDFPPPSIMQIKNGEKTALELFLFPWGKNQAGLELGFLVGNKDIISALENLQRNVQSQMNNLVLELGLKYLKNYSSIIEKIQQEYRERRKCLIQGLEEVEWKVKRSKATPFLWVKIPERYSSLGFARMLLRKAGVLVSPGNEFGEQGEGYIRLCLNTTTEKSTELKERLKKHSHFWQRKYQAK